MSGRQDISSLLRMPAVAEAVMGPVPAWLWDVAAGRVVLASASGADFFDAADSAALAERSFDMRRPAMMQLARLADQLPPDGTPRLAMLRFFVGLRDASVAGLCRLVDPAERDLVLVVAAGARADGRSDAERATVVFGGLPCPIVLRGPDGELYRNPAASQVSPDADAPALAALDGQEGRIEIVAPDAAGTIAGDAVEAIGTEASQEPPSPEAPGAHGDAPEAAGSAPDAAAAAPEPVAADGGGEEGGGGPASGLRDPAAQPPRRLPETRRFTFMLDADGRFAEVGTGFGAIVGAAAAAVVGRTWAEIAATFRVDPDGLVSAALESRDTWSDILVDWPTDFGDRVRLRLSALPRFGGGRAFAGFRGFADALELLAAPPAPADAVQPEAAGAEPRADEGAGAFDVVFADEEIGSPPPAESATLPQASPPGHGPLVRIMPGGPAPDEQAGLSDRERTAFQAIARALGARMPGEDEPQPGEASAPDADGPDSVEDEPPAADAAPADEGGHTAEAHDRHPPVEAPGEAPDEPEDTAAAEPAAAEPAPATEAGRVDASLIAELMDRVPIGLAVVRDARILTANRAFLDLFGFDDLSDLEVSGGLATLLEGRTGGEADAGASVTARRRDGTPVQVDVRLCRTPWIDGPAMLMSARQPDAPAPAPVVVAGQPEREPSTDAELAELRAVVEMAVDGVAILGADGAIASVNPGARRLMAGCGPDLLGKPLVDCVAPAGRSRAVDLLEGMKAAGVPSVLAEGRELSLIGADGTGVPVHMTIGRIGSGEPPRFCAVMRDLTKWKEAEAALVEARKRAEDASAQKSDFLAKISHEIRTPLNGIIGFSEVMSEERFGPLGSERYREYVKDIRDSGEHIMSLVNDLLDLSKVEAGKLELSFAGVKLNDLVEQTVAIMGPQANRSQVIIRTSLASGLPSVVADARSIRQVLLNLLSNAIKFTPPGGQVIVSTVSGDAGEILVRVRDTGIGMSETDIAAALEPFRQLAVAASDRERGTGLGLPLSKALTEANRAGFALHSKAGEGTMVEIRFPQSRVLSE